MKAKQPAKDDFEAWAECLVSAQARLLLKWNRIPEGKEGISVVEQARLNAVSLVGERNTVEISEKADTIKNDGARSVFESRLVEHFSVVARLLITLPKDEAETLQSDHAALCKVLVSGGNLNGYKQTIAISNVLLSFILPPRKPAVLLGYEQDKARHEEARRRHEEEVKNADPNDPYVFPQGDYEWSDYEPCPEVMEGVNRERRHFEKWKPCWPTRKELQGRLKSFGWDATSSTINKALDELGDGFDLRACLPEEKRGRKAKE